MSSSSAPSDHLLDARLMSSLMGCNITKDHGLFEIPHWVDHVSPVYKQLRKSSTRKWGYVTLILSLLSMILLPLYYRYSGSFRRWLTIPASRKLRLVNLFSRHSSTIRIIIFWLAFTIAVTFPNTYHDLLFISKRLGRVSAALLPTVFFLTLRPCPLPMLYLNLVGIHKWLSRIVVLQALIHALIYLAYFGHSGTIFKAYNVPNLFGWLALFGFFLIGLTSIFPVRRANYRFFYINHYLTSWAIIILIHLHSRPPAKLITALNGFILTYQIYLRFTNTSLVRISVKDLSDSLEIVDIDLSQISSAWYEFKQSVMPCSHLRIQKKFKNPFVNVFYRYFCPLAHPFSIASLPSDKSLLLVVRKLKFDLNNHDQYYITGNYEPDFEFLSYNRYKYRRGTSTIKKFFSSLCAPPVLPVSRLSDSIISLTSRYEIAASRVLMIIGGSGISVALPLLRILSIRGVPSKIIWVIKDARDLLIFKTFKNIDIHSMEIYLTNRTYNFNTMDAGRLRLDKLFERIDGETSQEVDFTSFKPRADTKNSTLDPSTPPLTPVNIQRRQRTKSMGSPLSIKPGAVAKKRSFKDILYRMHLDTNTDDDYDDNIQGTKADEVTINVSDSTEGKKDYGTTLNTQEITRSLYTGMVRQLKIFQGRPTLGSEVFDWCLNHICDDTTLSTGLCLADPTCPHSNTYEDLEEIIRKVWVVAVGPPGIINKSRYWADNNNLNFHGESFAL